MLDNMFIRKRLKRFFLIFFYLIFLIGNSWFIKAQQTLNGRNPSVYISLVSGITQKATFHRSEGYYTPTATRQPYWETGADYQYYFANGFSLLSGLHFNVSGRNTIFNAPVQDINPGGYNTPYILKNNNFDVGIILPLLLEKWWLLRHYTAIYINGGIQLHYSLGYDYDSYRDYLEDSAGTEIKIFSTDLNANNNRKPWITYSLESGYLWPLRNNNILKLGLVFNFSITNFINGSYQINVPGKPLTQGAYHVTGSYIGISAKYGFRRS